jgi:Zn-dependent alcohol dehydrogenase
MEWAQVRLLKIGFDFQVVQLLERHRNEASKLDIGVFPFDKLVRTFPMSEINEAIDAQHHGECVKVVLIP